MTLPSVKKVADPAVPYSLLLALDHYLLVQVQRSLSPAERSCGQGGKQPQQVQTLTTQSSQSPKQNAPIFALTLTGLCA